MDGQQFLDMNITDLPVELQEKLFTYLDDKTLFSARCVCSLWEQIAQRTIWQRSISNIPEDVLSEIMCVDVIQKSLSSCDWENIYAKWLNSKMDDKPPLTVSPIYVELGLVTYRISGNFLIVTTRSGHARMYTNGGEAVCDLASTDVVIWDIAMLDVQKKGMYTLNQELGYENLNLCHDFMLVICDRFLQLYKLPVDDNATSTLMWSVNDLSMAIPKSSTFGSLFAVAETATELTIREAKITERTLSVNVIHKVRCRTWLWKWNIWKNKVICIQATGEIAVWSFASETWISTSKRYAELLYQNPCFIYRGVIFCSSRTSQSLLEYWHCYPGDAYWLVCWDGETFHKYFPKSLMGENVTSVLVKRRLVVFGTYTGKIYIYDHKGFDIDIGKIWELQPMHVFQVSDQPVRSCDVGFENNVVTMAVRTEKNEVTMLTWKVLIPL